MMIRLLIPCMLAVCFTATANAEKFHSNGLGGGAWEEPTTWRNRSVPGADDDVIISRNDQVIYSSPATDGTACASLLLDPDAVLRIKPLRSAPQAVFHAGGAIDCYGTLQIDLSTRPDASVTIALLGEDEAARTIKLRSGGALLLFGAPDPLDGQRNILITSPTDDIENPRPDLARINAMEGASLDLRWTAFRHLSLDAEGIDNTGYESGARLNIANNHFMGESRVTLLSCDTPMIAGNRFEGPRVLGGYAIQVRASSIATVVNNTIIGTYNSGIAMGGGSDCRVANNTMDVQHRGISLYSISGIVQNNIIRSGRGGIHANMSTPTIEGGFIQVDEDPITLEASDAHLTSVRIDPAVADMPLLVLDGSRATLLNMPIEPEQVKVISPPKGKDRPTAQAFMYCVVKLNGRVEPVMRLDARTVGAAPDRPDLNVRHAPVRVGPDGFSALPASREALELLTWSIDIDGNVATTPNYLLRVTGAVLPGSETPRVLVEREVRPDADWFRAEPNALKATLEVTLP